MSVTIVHLLYKYFLFDHTQDGDSGSPAFFSVIEQHRTGIADLVAHRGSKAVGQVGQVGSVTLYRWRSEIKIFKQSKYQQGTVVLWSNASCIRLKGWRL